MLEKVRGRQCSGRGAVGCYRLCWLAGAAAEATGDSDSDGQADAGEVEAELDAFFEPVSIELSGECNAYRLRAVRAPVWCESWADSGCPQNVQFAAVVYYC